MGLNITTVEVEGVFLEVHFTYHPAVRGYRNSFGAPEEPDEPEDLEIEAIRHCGGDIMEIMDDASISKARAEILAGRYT